MLNNTYTGPTDPVLLLKGKLIHKAISCEILLKAYSRQQASSDTFQAILTSLKKGLIKNSLIKPHHPREHVSVFVFLLPTQNQGKNHYCLFTVMVIMQWSL